jgi:RND superfamily putative drug exporter
MGMTAALARASSRRPWVTLAAWVAAIAAAGFVSATYLGDALTSDIDFTNQPEAKRAAELVERRFGDQGITEVFLLTAEQGGGAEDPAYEQAVRELQARVQRIGGNEIQSVVTYFDTQDPSMLSRDGETTIMPVVFRDRGDVPDHLPEVESILAAGDASPVLQARSFGSITLDDDFSRLAEEDLARGESIGIGVAVVVLLIVFGAVVAGLLPIVMAVAAIAIAVGIVALFGFMFDFSFFVTNMITMMGLAVGIDYSLFIVSRYREERRKGSPKLEAIDAMGATASRAVFFSGLTVVFALIGMLIIPTTIFRSLASGAIFVVVIAVLASLTLLPALLSLLGDRVNALRVLRRRPETGTEESHRFWDRITHGVMRRPLVSLVLGAGLLLAASFSYLDINTGFAGVSTLPEDTRSKQAFEMLVTEFSGGMNSPVQIVVDGDVGSSDVQDDIAALQSALQRDGMFGPSSVQPNEAGTTAIVSAPIAADPSSEAATAAISRIREDYVPAAFEGSEAEVLVGGDTAFSKDFFDLTDSYTPLIFAFVLGLSFLLLTVVFRSIVVPIKAIVMNLLSVGAAYGLIVAVFQNGFAADLLGFRQVEAIEAWLPLFLFSILFGLSMDYHVFLLSRIRERFDQTHDNTESVAYGLRTTGGLITGAAIIMVAVFGGFAAGELVMMQQMGFGLAVAVFLDATIVRSVLVPATMRLLGDRNWYLPRWLQWLPDVRVEGAQRRDVMEPEPVPAASAV